MARQQIRSINDAFDFIGRLQHLLVPLSFLSLIIVLVIPLPTPIMDVLLAANISLAAVILMTTVYMKRPLDFSVFPALLLATTLIRLVLNVATTRLILGADASSPADAMDVAGEVISAFGTFVAGASPVVGVIIFIILVVVQFVVITKGATRMSEVAARFTLDAMPGKQMAIDADLSAGLIDEQEARTRRNAITEEADFYGAMDGASKFVRGDAIAGIVITIVNLVGGFAIGMVEKGWTFAETLKTFTMLTIGDGLVSQIPSFVIAIAAGLIVARANEDSTLAEQMPKQLASQPTALLLISGFLLLLAFTPLPTGPLLFASVTLALLAWAMRRIGARHRAEAERREEAAVPASNEPPPAEDLLSVDTMEIEIGYGLVALADTRQGGDLLARIAAIRRQLAEELGIVLPPVRVRDNMQLDANSYNVRLRGAVIGNATVYPNLMMAMDTGIATGAIDGIAGMEPAFGLPATWVEPDLRQRAETMNYTVVDPTSVVATHLTELVRTHAGELLSREEVNHLLEQLRKHAPKLVEETIPSAIKPGELQKVLQNLLDERVPVRDLERIVETLGDWAVHTKDLTVLTEYVRNALRRTITAEYAELDDEGRSIIHCVTMDPRLDDMIEGHIDRGPAGVSVTMPPDLARRIATAVAEAAEGMVRAGHRLVVLTAPNVRAQVRQILEAHGTDAAVLSYNEVVKGTDVESSGLVSLPDAAPVGVGLGAMR